MTVPYGAGVEAGSVVGDHEPEPVSLFAREEHAWWQPGSRS